MFKKKAMFSALIIVIILLILFTFTPTSLFADPAISGTDLNLYQGNGVASDSYVKFGKYNGSDIIWRVLRRDDGTNGVLLISDKILTKRAYSDTVVIWRDSNIRSWLNDDFYNNLGEDKKYIQSSTITTNSVDTTDYVFLADSSTTYAQPFTSDLSRIAYYNSIPTNYWLRTTTDVDTQVAYTTSTGSFGTTINATQVLGIRPLLYLQQSLSFSGSGSEVNPYIIYTGSEGGEAVAEPEPVWVRTMPITCWQIFINEDNMFEFIFWYPYKDNNWMQIFDMEGNMVYEVDVPLKDPHIIVDLPDGMYNVKTFRFDPEDPIQEFIIGEP